MRHILAITLLSVIVAAVCPPDGTAQCKVFVKGACIPVLNPYIHDGSYQAAIMSEGEEAEVYKTVFAGQQYRLYVCVDQVMPDVEFVVSDIHRNILFDSRKNGNVRQWDFRPDASQQIKVTVRIPVRKENNENPTIGCVGVFFGLKEK
ncbi:MAG: hypothetical protein LBR08_08435 [Bacteroidales bacterium]|jgi:hypothetical protein|nr:hypothetical protein [Bacteroidales bacterium]